MAIPRNRLASVVAATLTATAIGSGVRTPVAAQSPTGTIDGKVRLNGPAVPSAIIRMGADPYCAELFRGKRPIQDTTVLSKDGGLANVFLSLSGTFPPSPVAAEPVTINQEACTYHPRVVGARVGQTLEIRNSDMTLHNIHSLSKNGNDFNVSEPVKGMVQKFKLDHEEVMLQIKCDAHRWMTDYVGVVNHPYFAVSADGGTFKITGVPAGPQTVQAWHEAYGTLTKTVDVKPGATTSVDLTYDRTQPAR
jgi:plastocyanin